MNSTAYRIKIILIFVSGKQNAPVFYNDCSCPVSKPPVFICKSAVMFHTLFPYTFSPNSAKRRKMIKAAFREAFVSRQAACHRRGHCICIRAYIRKEQVRRSIYFLRLSASCFPFPDRAFFITSTATTAASAMTARRTMAVVLTVFAEPSEPTSIVRMTAFCRIQPL